MRYVLDLFCGCGGFSKGFEMVGLCDKGIAIWDGTSRGTKHCITKLKKAGKLLKIFRK
jgi:hypothetical protein